MGKEAVLGAMLFGHALLVPRYITKANYVPCSLRRYAYWLVGAGVNRGQDDRLPGLVS